jgi:hypothetical protein
MSHRAIHNHTYHFSHFILFTLYFGIFGCTDPRRDCTSFYGKKGLKAQRDCSWQKIKAKTITFQMLAQGGIENNETFLLRNLRRAETNSYYIDAPLVEGSTQVRYNFCFTPIALCVPLPSSDIVVLPPKSHITLLELLKLMQLQEPFSERMAKTLAEI